MRIALLVALTLAPLVASAAFSEFEVSKWLAVALGILMASFLGWRQGLDHFLKENPSFPIGAIVLLAVGGMSLAAAGSADFQSALIDLSRLVLPYMLSILVAFAWSGKRSSSLLLLGACLPVLLILAQLALDAGIFPLEVPHQEGVWTGTIGNGALLGECALVFLGFILLLLREQKGKAALGVGVGLGLAATYLIYVSDSRGVWMGTLVFFGALVFLDFTVKKPGIAPQVGKKWMHPGWLFSFFLFVFIFMAWVAPKDTLQNKLTARLQSITDRDHPTNVVRIALAEDAVSMAMNRSFLGTGGGRFGSEHGQVRQKKEWVLSGLESRVDDPHNELLRLLAEYGLVGTILILIIVLCILGRLWQQRSQFESRVALAMWLGLLVLSCTWATFKHPATVVPLAFLTGLGFRSSSKRVTTTATPTTWRTIVVLGLGVFCSLSLLLWAERDSAATSLRDRGEQLKEAFAEASQEKPEESAKLLADLGIVGKSIRRVAQSAWLAPSLRYRLLKTVYNLAEQRTMSEALVIPQGNVGATMLFNASKSLPSLAEAKTLANEILSQAPYHLPTRRLQARMEILAGNKAAAVVKLEEILTLNPDEPFARQFLAELYVEGETQLYALALEHLDEQLERWGDVEVAADASWQLKARCLGATGDILGALSCVKDWTEALGSAERRLAVGGELSLFIGETEKTIGIFIADPSTWDRRQERGSFTINRFEGLPARELRLKLLSHLGEHPHDTPVLDRLRDVLFDILQDTGDRDAALERMRDRVIARSRVHYAWENHLLKEERNLRVCLRIAKRKSPRQGDPYFIEILHAIQNQQFKQAKAALLAWKQRGFKRFDALRNHPELAKFRSHPEIRAILSQE